MKKCKKCNGLGKLKETDIRWCNCGSGEGCPLHDEVAISMWGRKCPDCKGMGKK